MTLIPTQVTFHGLTHRDDIESDIRERVSWLEQFYSGIVRCRVLVEIPHRHRRGGRHFHVGIELTVAGGAPIVVNHDPSLHGRSKDVEEVTLTKGEEIDGELRYARAAIHAAFDAARRRLEDVSREQHGAVKAHAAS
jgi:sigma 54 modulation/S30EA-like ribosomal protein